ncbi:hypothetical protein, partial [Vibrio anguillarum]|uniref:hypothetical protein n=1 Tax=Vibrio anguillarum TaxID=55601 RepID=UPI001BE4A212
FKCEDNSLDTTFNSLVICGSLALLKNEFRICLASYKSQSVRKKPMTVVNDATSTNHWGKTLSNQSSPSLLTVTIVYLET